MSSDLCTAPFPSQLSGQARQLSTGSVVLGFKKKPNSKKGKRLVNNSAKCQINRRHSGR